jgi:hypothetical protein
VKDLFLRVQLAALVGFLKLVTSLIYCCVMPTLYRLSLVCHLVWHLFALEPITIQTLLYTLKRGQIQSNRCQFCCDSCVLSFPDWRREGRISCLWLLRLSECQDFLCYWPRKSWLSEGCGGPLIPDVNHRKKSIFIRPRMSCSGSHWSPDILC